MLANCKKYLSLKVFRDVFELTYDRMRRYEGTWHLERRSLFPGYIFLESEDRAILSEWLGECGILERMIQVGRKEEKFLKELCGEAHNLKMSRGIIWKGNTRITEGPLKGREKQICGIDRHKRIARVEIRMEPDYYYIPAGLEITEKS